MGKDKQDKKKGLDINKLAAKIVKKATREEPNSTDKYQQGQRK